MITDDAYAQYPETYRPQPDLSAVHSKVVCRVAVIGIVFVALLFAAFLAFAVIEATTPEPLGPSITTPVPPPAPAPPAPRVGPPVTVLQRVTPTLIDQ